MVNSEYLLSDEQMAQFIAKGYVVLHNPLPQELHDEIMKKIYYVLHEEGNPGNNILPRVPQIGDLFDTPQVKGALTSVLGPDYYMHPHRHCHYNRPGNDKPGGGQWHKDGYWSAMRSHRPWWAMIFYYTHDVTEDLGPTAIMPGTHYYEKFLGEKGETLLPTGKAGTIVLVHFDLWHKASVNLSNLDRYMLKFQFMRLHAPDKPTWNHLQSDMPLVEGTPFTHLTLWHDIWNWLRGEHDTQSKSKETDPVQLKQLQSDLHSVDAAVRSQAADELGFIGETAATLAADLGLLLEDSEETVALNAAYALGHMGHQGIQVLLDQLAAGTNLIATRAAYGLQAGGVQAVPGLVEALQHPNEKHRALAAFTLGMIGPAAKDSINALIESIQEKNEWVRRNAIESLGMIAQSTAQTVPALAKALEEAVNNERVEMDEGRGSLYVENQKYITNKIGYTAALALLRTGKEGDALIVVRALSKALESKDRYVRAYASEALTHLRTKEAIDALVHYYRTSRWCADTHKASSF